MNIDEHFRLNSDWEREDYDELNELIEARVARELRAAEKILPMVKTSQDWDRADCDQVIARLLKTKAELVGAVSGRPTDMSLDEALQRVVWRHGLVPRRFVQ